MLEIIIVCVWLFEPAPRDVMNDDTIRPNELVVSMYSVSCLVMSGWLGVESANGLVSPSKCREMDVAYADPCSSCVHIDEQQ